VRGRVGVFRMGVMMEVGLFLSLSGRAICWRSFDFDIPIDRMYGVNVYLYLSSGS